jgi:guanosine-3',5'-bis(diphosphate) 3'-pyrophosphohydrolase
MKLEKDPQIIWQELESILKQNPERYNIDAIYQAYLSAKNCHRGQKRKSGEPYICHPLRAAIEVAKLEIDTPTVEAAILHDVVEDTPCNLETIKKNFGDEVAFLVNGVTKLGHIKYRGVEEEVENFRKMIIAMSEDIRVILIKLMDRFDNMRTLEFLPAEKRRRIAIETLDIYAPIAHRLGIGELAGNLEDLAFPYVYPKEYEWLTKTVSERYEERKRYLENLLPIVEKALKDAGVSLISISTRPKHYYSLYKKLLRKDMNLDLIYDLVAMRIIVENVESCYATLGIIHSLWKPVPGRIKDYIALPKPNGYRSLHTTVFGPNGKLVEIQIRTKEMHEEAERGIAAHWHYTEKKNIGKNFDKIPKEFAWVTQLQKWQEEHDIKDDFIESLKIDFFKDRIFVITPKGDVLDLPEGSTPVDFAYHIHTDIGNQCAGAKVNGKIVPLDYRLSSGDIVEILTQKNKMPSEQWLEFVKTSFARNKIKEALKKARKINISTKEKPQAEMQFQITVKDRVGLLKDIAKVFAAANVNIVELNTEARKTGYPIIMISAKISDPRKAENIAMKIRKIKNVESVGFKLRNPR